MRRRLVLAALAILAAAHPAGAAEGAAPVATRVLLARLHAAGRAEASLRLVRRDPLSGRTTTLRGRLALEPPHYARLDLGDGERLALRADGGDWLQPATRQLVRGGARAVAGLIAWWGALLDPAKGGLRETRTAGGRYLLTSREGGEDLTQRVELGTDGLPRRVVVATSPEDSVEYRIEGWRFTRPRGRADFVLEPPAGYETVEMP